MSETDDVKEGPPSRAELEEEPGWQKVETTDEEESWFQIVSLFTNHKPSEDQVDRMEVLRIHARVLMREIRSSCPSKRAESSFADQRLREAIMWGNSAIVLENT